MTAMDIRDLVRKDSIEAVLQLHREGASPLSSEQLETIENNSSAACNVHTAVLMGMRVVAEYLYLAGRVEEEPMDLNAASGLVGLLADLAELSYSERVTAEQALTFHWKLSHEEAKAEREVHS